jgi:BrnA antitoxin of type II toxin-antitoxin system
MNETEQVVSIGDPMPRLASVAGRGAYEIVVSWAAGSTREHNADLVDLAPLVLTHKLYRPLRDDPDLFKTVHLIEGGSAIAWGDDDAIDMAATSVERLAEEQMSSADFHSWLEQHKLTYDATAAQLGISRRLVAYYAADQRPVPRYIALACRYLDLVELAPKAARVTRLDEYEDAPEWTDTQLAEADLYEGGKLVRRGRRKQLLDPEVAEALREGGPGLQARIKAVLRKAPRGAKGQLLVRELRELLEARGVKKLRAKGAHNRLEKRRKKTARQHAKETRPKKARA